MYMLITIPEICVGRAEAKTIFSAVKEFGHLFSIFIH